MQGLLCRIWTTSDASLCASKMGLAGLQVRGFKTVTNRHQHAKTTEDEKVYIFNNE